MNNVVFIAGKGKKDYFQRISSKINGGDLLEKKNLPILSLYQLYNSTRNIKKTEYTYISEYFLKVKAKKYQSNHPIFWKLYQRIIHLRSLIYFSRYSQYFKNHKGEWVALWGGHYLDDRAAEVAAKKMGMKIFFFENGLLPNTTTVDTKGVNFKNSVPREQVFYTQYMAKNAATSKKSLTIRQPIKQQQQKPITLPCNYIFVPFQVDTDTQIILHGNWIESMRNFFSVIQQTMLKLPQETVFIFKEHPSSPENYDDLRKNLGKSLIFANGNSTEELILNATAVITVNSTVGIEALLLGKRVITLGNAFYSIPGLVKQANSITDLTSILQNLASWAINSNLTHNFLAYLREQYLVEGSWRTCDSEHLDHVTNKLTTLMKLSNSS